MQLTRPRPTAAPPAPPGRVRRAYRSRGFAAFSAVLLAVIAAAAVWVALAGDEPADTPPAEAPAASSTEPATPAGEGGCPALPFEDQSLPPDAPPSTWITESPFAAAFPTSATAGPAPDSSGAARCYARTPVGALFAAAGFLSTVSDPARVYAAVQDLTVPNAGQDVLLQRVATDPASVVGTSGGYEIDGFTFLSSGLDTVAVAVVLRYDAGGLVAVPVTLTWSEGSWLVRLPDDGRLADRADPLATTEGFRPWRAA